MSNRFANCPYTERRLRPIYDSLDNLSNKKALQEADKLLKKQPNLLCAKALKCLALLRLGKESESLELLEAVKNGNPIDESTLQAATVCYREVNQPHSICELYEKASIKQPNNEDILNSLFLAYVRVGDYPKQRLTAMSLYKLTQQKQYYFWAIISTLLQSVEDVNDLIQLCSIPCNKNYSYTISADDKAKTGISLVHRLIEKCMNEDKIESEQEVLTYLLVLDILGKYDEAYNTLQGPLRNKLEKFTVTNKELDLLVKLERWEEVNSNVMMMLEEDEDCWHCYLIYLNSVFELSKGQLVNSNNEECPFVKAKEFLNRLVTVQIGSQCKKRGPYLARLEYYSMLLEKDQPVNELFGEFLPLLEEYYTEFGAKESCIHDLRKYINLRSGDVLAFLSFAYKCIKFNQDGIPANKTQLNLLVSHAELRRVIGLNNLFGVNDRHKFILNEINTYINCAPICADAAVTDVKSCDRLALNAAHSLFELWTDTEESDYLFEAIAICEYALSQSSSNAQLKILLLKFYHLIGGTECAQMTYVALDLKHMQLDTLGYLHLFPLISNASYLYANNVLNSSIKFFTINSKESADHVTIAYKYEALTKIPEFVGIKAKMGRSTHYLLSTTEKMLCEMFTSLGYSSSVQLAKDMEICLNLDYIQWNDLRDNRDFTVIWDIEAPDRRLTEECIVQSHNHNLLFLRLRSLLLYCIVSCLDVGKVEVPSTKGVSEPSEHSLTYAKLRPKMIEYCIQIEETLKPVKNNIPSSLSKRFIAGPPVSRLLLILQVNYFDLILNEMRFLYNLVPSEDSNCDKCQYQLNTIVLFVDEYLTYIRSISGSSQILVRNTFIQVCALIVELVCFSCIVVSVCNEIMVKSRQNQAKKNKKKKENIQRSMDSSDEFEWRAALINKFVAFLVKVINALDSILKCEEELWNDKNIKLCELLISGSIDNKEECNKIQSVSNAVLEKLHQSYVANITQMSTVLKIKLKYLTTLKI